MGIGHKHGGNSKVYNRILRYSLVLCFRFRNIFFAGKFKLLFHEFTVVLEKYEDATHSRRFVKICLHHTSLFFNAIDHRKIRDDRMRRKVDYFELHIQNY